jgi:hypothetical protein
LGTAGGTAAYASCNYAAEEQHRNSSVRLPNNMQECFRSMNQFSQEGKPVIWSEK